MEIKPASFKGKKLRVGISAPSGYGKTYSSLLAAFGMCDDWKKICVIDTEESSGLYHHLGPFNVINLKAPFNPEKFTSAIKLAEDSGMEVIILDSLSAEWQGQGGCLDIHESLGGRFQDWAPVKKRHQALIDAILNSKCHIITCVRRKVEYSLDKDNTGKSKVFKLGTKEITQEGFEYELDVNFEIINDNHLCKATKDRLNYFMNKPEFVINASTGKKLIQLVSSPVVLKQLKQRVEECLTLSELTLLYNENPTLSKTIEKEFIDKRDLLQKLINNATKPLNGNGTNHI